MDSKTHALYKHGRFNDFRHKHWLITRFAYSYFLMMKPLYIFVYREKFDNKVIQAVGDIYCEAKSTL